MRLGRFLIRFFHPLFWLVFPYKVVGREYLPKKGDPTPLVLCCNHISYIDPVYLLMAQPRHIYFMGKEELFHSWFGRWFLGKQMGVFAVSRGKGDINAIEVAKGIVNEGKLMGIFPEGTRSKDGALGRGKSGASLIVSQTGASVIPACVVTKGQKVRVFRRATIAFGPLLTPEELHLQNPEKPELRYGSRKIMESIEALMRQNGWQPPAGQADDRAAGASAAKGAAPGAGTPEDRPASGSAQKPASGPPSNGEAGA